MKQTPLRISTPRSILTFARSRYPWVVSGAIASSVSVQKHLLRRSNIFWQIVTEAYHNVSATCPKLIRAGWDQINEKAATASGRSAIKVRKTRPFLEKISS